MWDYWVECWCRAVDANRRNQERFSFCVKLLRQKSWKKIQNRDIHVEPRVQEIKLNEWLDRPKLQALLRSENSLPVCRIQLPASQLSEIELRNLRHRPSSSAPIFPSPFSWGFENTTNSKHSPCRLPFHTIFHTRDLTSGGISFECRSKLDTLNCTGQGKGNKEFSWSNHIKLKYFIYNATNGSFFHYGASKILQRHRNLLSPSSKSSKNTKAKKTSSEWTLLENSFKWACRSLLKYEFTIAREREDMRIIHLDGNIRLVLRRRGRNWCCQGRIRRIQPVQLRRKPRRCLRGSWRGSKVTESI